MTNILNELIADIISLGEVRTKKPKIRASKTTKTDFCVNIWKTVIKLVQVNINVII